jgi:hypothetical protein
MSTAIQESYIGGSALHQEEKNARITFRAPEAKSLDIGEAMVRYSFPEKKHIPPEPKRRVLRRLNGFLMAIQGRNARVAFIENGKTFEYDMPADRLQRSGIEIINQPFEMDEFETRTDDGLEVGYRFRPLAKASDLYVETLNFDEERKRKRDLIFKKFAKTKG